MGNDDRRIKRIEQGRGHALLRRIGQEPLRGAEIGVQRGLLSAYLLRRRPDLTLYMIDPWQQWAADSRLVVKGGDRLALRPKHWQDAVMAQAVANTEFAADRREIVQKTSVDAAADVAVGSLDFVFIDAEHTYEGCREDIDAWLVKLKDGGLLSGHDIDNTDHTWSANYDGVRRAVEQTASILGVTFETDVDYTWFMRIP
jgi:hypothetical protein